MAYCFGYFPLVFVNIGSCKILVSDEHYTFYLFLYLLKPYFEGFFIIIISGTVVGRNTDSTHSATQQTSLFVEKVH